MAWVHISPLRYHLLYPGVLETHLQIEYEWGTQDT